MWWHVLPGEVGLMAAMHGAAYYWAAGSYAAQCIEQGLRAIAKYRLPWIHWDWCACSGFRSTIPYVSTPETMRVTCPMCLELMRQRWATTGPDERFDNS